jgi:hypothetical protein
MCVILQPWLKSWSIKTSFTNSNFVIPNKMIDYIEHNSFRMQHNTTIPFTCTKNVLILNTPRITTSYHI